MNARTDPLFIQSLARGLDLLACFATRPGSLSLNELAAESGLDRSAVQRIVHTLLATGYLERGAGGRGYRPGKRILDRSYDYLRSVPLLERASALLGQLHEESGERVALSLFDDLSIVVALRRPARDQAYAATLVGRRLAAVHTAGGRAVLARLSDARVEDIIARTGAGAAPPRALAEADRIRAAIARARSDGYAVAVEENPPGEITLATAVVDDTDQPVAAVHVSASLAQWGDERFRHRFAPPAIDAARALSGKPALG